MISLAEGFFGVGILVSLGLCALGVYSYRRWDEPGMMLFAAFTVLLGLGGVAGGGASLLIRPLTEEDVVVWSQVSFLALFVWSVPWGLFGFQYTGRLTRLRWRTAGLLLAPVVLVVFPMFAIGLTTDVEIPLFVQLIGGIVFLYALFLLGTSIYLLLQTTYTFGHLSFAQGVSLCAAPIGHFAILNIANSTQIVDSTAAISELYVVGYLVPAVALGVSLFWHDTFESSPAAGTIGKRTIIQQTDDLVFVVDDRERIIKLNETAVETLDVSREPLMGAQLYEPLGDDVDGLRNQDTVALEVADGTRQYDVEVSTVTDQHGRELGALVSLHDVTEHELREQRLAVLNRVLRHNLRNKVEVVKSHAEILDERDENGHAATIADTADTIADLGHSARTIDQFVSRSDTSNEVDIVDAIETTVTSADPDRDDVTVSLDLPESATVETNCDALRGALDSAIDNAVTYAERSVDITVADRPDGYEISIADDGPGIPEGELDCLDAGTETALEHGTGLGLWQLKWAVTTMGGDLDFDTSDGTTVRFTVPDRECVETASGFTTAQQDGSIDASGHIDSSAAQPDSFTNS